MCFGGEDERDYGQLQITGAEKKDAATQARERELWKHTSAYALQQPFSNQYSTMPRDFPGLGTMSQRGQEYTTDAILGKGQYSPADPAKNLGFTDYKPWVDPPSAIKPYETDYDPDDEYRYDFIEPCPTGHALDAAGECQPKDDGLKKSWQTCADKGMVDNGYGGCTKVNTDTDTVTDSEELKKRAANCARFGQVPDGSGGCTNYYDPDALKKFDLDYENLSRMLLPLNPQLQAQKLEGMATRSLQAGFDPVSVGGTMTPVPYLQMLDPSIQGGYGDKYEWQGDLEQASLANWLGDQGFVTNALNFTPLSKWDSGHFGGAGSAGSLNLNSVRPYENQAMSGERNVAVGQLGYDPGQAYYGIKSRHDTVDPATGQVVERAPVVDPVTGQPTQLASQVPPSLGGLGLSAGPPGMPPDIGGPGLPPGIAGPDIATDRPGPDQAYMPPDIGGPGLPPPMLTGGPSLGSGLTLQLPHVAAPVAGERLWDEGGLLRPSKDTPLSPTVGVGNMEMGALATRRMLEQSRPEDPTYTDLTDTDSINSEKVKAAKDISKISDITVDPITGQKTQRVTDVVPKEFGGASFLDYMNQAGVAPPDGPMLESRWPGDPDPNDPNRPAKPDQPFGRTKIQDYMNQAGVEAQVAQAQEDYLREQNRLQADQAQAQAWGTRGQLPAEEAREAQQRNLAQIRGAGFERAAQLMESDTERRQQAGLQGQQLSVEAGLANRARETQRREADAARAQQVGMQGQQIDVQLGIQNAQNELRVAEQNMQSALQTNDQQAALNAQRKMADAQMQLDAATRNQAAELQVGGMGLDARGQFRGQQLAAAQQLADIGGMTQGATFGAGAQLQQMGAQQDQARRLQQAFAYEQWLRGQEGGAQALALRQGMMPGGTMEQFSRKPSVFGQIAGLATTAAGAYAASGSDVRIKENIKYAGVKDGFNLYEFNYLGSDNRYKGVMAQEVMKQRPDAVESRNGVYWVNYGALGIQLEAV